MIRLESGHRIMNVPVVINNGTRIKLRTLEKHIKKLMVTLGGRKIPKRELRSVIEEFHPTAHPFLYSAIDANISEYIALESSAIAAFDGVHHPYLGSMWYESGVPYEVKKVKKVWRKGKQWYVSLIVDRNHKIKTTSMQCNKLQRRTLGVLLREVKRADGEEAVYEDDAFGVRHAKEFGSQGMNYLRINLDECVVRAKRRYVNKYECGMACRVSLPYFKTEQSGLLHLSHEIPEGTKYLDMYQTEDKTKFLAYFRSE